MVIEDPGVAQEDWAGGWESPVTAPSCGNTRNEEQCPRLHHTAGKSGTRLCVRVSVPLRNKTLTAKADSLSSGCVQGRETRSTETQSLSLSSVPAPSAQYDLHFPLAGQKVTN